MQAPRKSSSSVWTQKSSRIARQLGRLEPMPKTDQKPKPPRGRPAVRVMPDPIPDTPENVVRALCQGPPKPVGQWEVHEAGRRRLRQSQLTDPEECKMTEREIKNYDGVSVTVSHRSGQVIINRPNTFDDRSQEVLILQPQNALRLAASLIDHAEQSGSAE